MAKIHEAIADIMGEVGSIKKDRTNTGQGYKFRGIDDVYLAIHDLFVKHGVFSVTTVLEERTEERTTSKGAALIYRVLKIKYEFFARDGSSITEIVIGEGMDSGDKASNKAMSVGHKYAILQLLAIPTEDTADPESDSHEVAPRHSLRPAPNVPDSYKNGNALASRMEEDDKTLYAIMTATVGAVAAFSDIDKAEARARRKKIEHITDEDAGNLRAIVAEYRARLESLQAAWKMAGSPTPRPAILSPKNEDERSIA